MHDALSVCLPRIRTATHAPTQSLLATRQTDPLLVGATAFLPLPQREGSVTHEMISDLSKYFINTSCNTVASGDGKVSVDAIARALKAGFRAVEFEVRHVPQ